MRRIGLAYVDIPDQSKENVAKALESGWVAAGEYIEQFEEQVARFCGTKHCISCCNGTQADMVVMLAMEEAVEFGPVYVPALTFAAQWNALILAGGNPVAKDIDGCWEMEEPKPGGLWFPAALMGRRSRFKGDHVVVDSCETFARDIGKDVLAATCSFFITHAVGIGEGGAIVTNDDHLACMCRAIRDHGQVPTSKQSEKFTFTFVGTNAKMSNLAAAVGCGIMPMASEIVAARRQVAKSYDMLTEADWSDQLESPHGYPLVCDSESQRDFILAELAVAGVEARRLFRSLPGQLAYVGQEGRSGQRVGGLEYPMAEIVARRWLYVPCHQGMSVEDVEYVWAAFCAAREKHHAQQTA